MTTIPETSQFDIQRELAHYSTKVSAPLKHLYDNNWLSLDDLTHILKVGELNRYPSTLLGFATIYVAAVNSHLPIKDAINMAHTLKRRFNMAWSANRIKEEHNRFSRMMTLKALAGSRKIYNVEPIARECNRNFPGYWITSSRRLGMEGLRQRHCVASYATKIESLECAIASLFINQVRWTVEVKQSWHDPDKLIINQMQSRMGVRADEATRKIAYDLLGIEMPPKPEQRVGLNDRESTDTTQLMQSIYHACVARGVQDVGISFYGGGDSGEFHAPIFNPTLTQEQDSGANIPLTRREKRYVEGRWVSIETTNVVSLSDAVEALAEIMVSNTGVDWYNNDGGDGNVVFNIQEAQLGLDVCYNVIEREIGASEVYDLLTGEAA